MLQRVNNGESTLARLPSGCGFPSVMKSSSSTIPQSAEEATIDLLSRSHNLVI